MDIEEQAPPKKKRAPRRKAAEKLAAPEMPAEVVVDEKDDEQRRSIATILSRTERLHRGQADHSLSSFVRPQATPKDFFLAVFVFLLFAVASTGIMMFIRKNGAPNFSGFISGLSSKKESVAAVSVPETPSAPTTPANVSVVFVVTSAAKKDDTGSPLTSRIIETDVKETASFPATGEGASTTAKSSGKATIVNTTSRPYTFVKTTRLLSKSGVLFRMTTTTSIPAKGSVVVEVVADQPGAKGDIGPTTFTVPGLALAVQKDVFAKSDAAMTGGDGKAKSVTEDDIAKAKTALVEKAKKEADANFASIASDGEKLVPDLVTASELSFTAPKPGTQGATFSPTLSLRFRALLVPEKAVLPLLSTAMTTAIPAGTPAADYSLGSVLYTVQAYDTTKERAEIRAEAPLIGGK